jgi:hypothetical protein
MKHLQRHFARKLQGASILGSPQATTTSPSHSSHRHFYSRQRNACLGTVRSIRTSPQLTDRSLRSLSLREARNASQNRLLQTAVAIDAGEPKIHALFEKKTGTWQYVVADPSTSTAVIIDPVLDYDHLTGIATTEAADSLLSLVKEHDYKIEMLLETHAHADHLTASSYLQYRLSQEQGFSAPIGIGRRIGQVQQLFGQRYGIPADEYEGVFDILLEDEAELRIGNLTAKALHIPGHTPDHLGYQIGGPSCSKGLSYPLTWLLR